MPPERPLDDDHDDERQPTAQVDPSSDPLAAAISVSDTSHTATRKETRIPRTAEFKRIKKENLVYYKAIIDGNKSQTSEIEVKGGDNIDTTLIPPTMHNTKEQDCFIPPNICMFSPTDFEKIMRLLSDQPTKELNQMLAAIFNRLGVVEWSDLMAESPESVEDALNGVGTGMGEMSLNMRKKLNYIVQYARNNGTLASHTTLRDIVQSVDAVPSLLALSATTPRLQTNNNGTGTVNEAGVTKSPWSGKCKYPQQKDKGDEFVKSIMQDYVDIQGSNGMRVLNGVLDLETHSTRNVVLRDMTEDFWQKVIEATSTHRVCALGTPGIGKTTTTCILIRLLLEQKITVLYRVLGIHNDGFVYMFTPMSKEPIEVDVNVIEEKNFSSWHPEANMTTIYYVVDPGKNLEKNCDLDSNYLGKVIIVASPDSNHWGGTQFWKQRGKSMTGTFLYNPVWRLDELIAAKEHFKYSLNEEEIRNRYEKVGGIPRHIFTDNVTFRGILRDQFFALNKLNKNQLQKMSSNDWDSVHTFDRSQPSSALMVYECPDNSYRKFNVAVASPHVMTEILKRNEMYMWM